MTDKDTERANWCNIVEGKGAAQRVLLKPYLLAESKLPPKEQRNIFHFFETSSDVLTAEDKRMTDVDDVETVLQKLRNREWKCEDLTRAYVKRAAIIHQLTNCITEPLFPAALKTAACLDNSPPTTSLPPLFGLPQTFKDQFNVIGVDTTLGYVSLCNSPVTSKASESVLVTLLRSLGAVPFAKTNLPQSIMWCETENPIFGLTTNPRDRAFTPGGSTGGDGVLLAMKGSLVGWGTDIGGSIRIPSALNGIYGLKPSSTRLPYQNTSVTTAGQEHVPSVIGPMTRSLSSLIFITRTLLSPPSEPWLLDPKVAPIPWRIEHYEKIVHSPKLRIGIIRDDGVVRVHPPIQRVLEEAVEELKNAGHELVDWKPDLHADAVAIMDKFYTADGGEDIRRSVEAGGEPLLPHVEEIITRGKPISVYEYWQLNKQKLDVQKRYLDKWNASTDASGKAVDLLLMPAMPHVAVPHRRTSWVGYTKIWNFLDYSAGVIPVSFVDKTLDMMNEEQKAYVPRNARDKFNWELYDPESMHGHPIALQVVARRLEEEKVLAGMKVIEDILKGRRVNGAY